VLLKVAVPQFLEVGPKLCDLFFRWAQFACNVNSVPAEERIILAERRGKVQAAAEDAVEGLVRLQRRLVRIQQQVVVLVLFSNAGHLGDDGDVELLQQFRTTDARSLED